MLKFFIFIWSAFLFLRESTPYLHAQLNRSIRQIPIGNSDFQGYARIDRMFYEMPLGNGNVADFFFKFSSDPEMEPRYMGRYWTIAFFDSRLFQESEFRYIWKSPNYGTYIFNKIPKSDRGFLKTYLLNTTGKWKLNVGKDEILITNSDDPKKLFKFKNGKLVFFCNGGNSDAFRINYLDGYPQSVYNFTRHVEIMKFIYNPGMLLSEIRLPLDGKSIFLTYTDIPFKSISSVVYADGHKETYKYSCKHDKILGYPVRNEHPAKTERSTNKMTIFANGDNVGFLEWDATTGIIISDSGGRYEVSNPKADKYNLEYANLKQEKKPAKRTQVSKITYKKPEYIYPEIWEYNSITAIKTIQNPNTGEQTRTFYIAAPGNVSMKIRKIEKKSQNDKDWKIQLLRVYNENGNILREIDGDENLTTFIYDKNGKHWKTLMNGLLTFMAYNDDKNDPLRFTKKNFDGSVFKIVKNNKGDLEIQETQADNKKTIAVYSGNDNTFNIKGFKFELEKER